MVAGLLGLRRRGREVGVGYELGQKGILRIKVESGGEPAVDGLRVELPHEDVPMVEIWMKDTIGEGWVGNGVL